MIGGTSSLQGNRTRRKQIQLSAGRQSNGVISQINMGAMGGVAKWDVLLARKSNAQKTGTAVSWSLEVSQMA